MGRRCLFRRGPSPLLAWRWAGYELEEVILVSISVRVERDFKAKQKHLPHPPPQPPDVTVSLIFTRWDWWGHHGTRAPSCTARNQSKQPLMGTRCSILIRSWLGLETDIFLTGIFRGLSCDNKWQRARESWHDTGLLETWGLSWAPVVCSWCKVYGQI